MNTSQKIIDRIFEDLGDDYDSPKQIADALCDGECLNAMGYTDADQAAIEEAYQRITLQLKNTK